MNNKNTNKTLLVLGIMSIMLVFGGIVIPVYATPGDLLLIINNPTPQYADVFGSYVATTSTGDLLVGVPSDGTGTVHLFDGNDGSLLLTIDNPIPETSSFGRQIAGTINGNILVGAISADSVYLFDTNGSILLTINNPTLESTDYFGYSVKSTINGNILAGTSGDDTGAIDIGSVHLFDGNDGSLLLTIDNPTPEEHDHFGRQIAGTINGNILVGAQWDNTGASDTGSAYLFDGTDGSLLLTINNPIPARGDSFGSSVAITPTGDFLVGAYGDDTFTTDTGSVYLFEGISIYTSAPIIVSILADDPDDLDNVYSAGDTITITFDSDTNTPGGSIIQTRTAVDDLFSFSESLGETYTGQWITSDTFIITITDITSATPPSINDTTVTPAGITSILSSDGKSGSSIITSPALSGDFGEFIFVSSTPVIIFTFPTDGQIFDTDSVTITGTITDPESTITDITIQLNSDSPVSITDNFVHTFTDLSNGVHLVTVKATNDQDLQSTGFIAFEVAVPYSTEENTILLENYTLEGNGIDWAVVSHTLSVDMDTGDSLVFDYTVSSGRTTDSGYIYINDDMKVHVYGEQSGVYTYTSSSSGVVNIEIEYSKGNGEDGGSDSFTINSLTHILFDSTEVEPFDPTLEEILSYLDEQTILDLLSIVSWLFTDGQEAQSTGTFLPYTITVFSELNGADIRSFVNYQSVILYDDWIALLGPSEDTIIEYLETKLTNSQIDVIPQEHLYIYAGLFLAEDTEENRQAILNETEKIGID